MWNIKIVLSAIKLNILQVDLNICWHSFEFSVLRKIKAVLSNKLKLESNMFKFFMNILLKIFFSLNQNKHLYKTTIILYYVFKASTSILFKSAERFSGCLHVLIHCLMPTFRKHCNSLYQGKQLDTEFSILYIYFFYIIYYFNIYTFIYNLYIYILYFNILFYYNLKFSQK